MKESRGYPALSFWAKGKNGGWNTASAFFPQFILSEENLFLIHANAPLTKASLGVPPHITVLCAEQTLPPNNKRAPHFSCPPCPFSNIRNINCGVQINGSALHLYHARPWANVDCPSQLTEVPPNQNQSGKCLEGPWHNFENKKKQKTGPLFTWC